MTSDFCNFLNLITALKSVTEKHPEETGMSRNLDFEDMRHLQPLLGLSCGSGLWLTPFLREEACVTQVETLCANYEERSLIFKMYNENVKIY